MLTNFDYLKMCSKEVARSIHVIVALSNLAANRKFAPKAIDYAPSDERTGNIDDTSEEVWRIILGNVVGHLDAQ